MINVYYYIASDELINDHRKHNLNVIFEIIEWCRVGIILSFTEEHLRVGQSTELTLGLCSMSQPHVKPTQEGVGLLLLHLSLDYLQEVRGG